MPEQTTDPFAPHDGWLARAAARLGCTEGQAYTMLIGLLLVSAVWSNALPHVIWRRTLAAPPVAAVVAPSPTSAPSPLVVPSGPALAPLPLPQPSLLPGLAEPSSAPAEQLFPFPTLTPTPDGPTRVVAGGWASSYAGTPLATFGVPDGDVVVSARATQAENVAYLKLTGEATPLVMQVDSSGTNTLGDLAALRLCAVTAPAWTVGRGDVPVDQAPATDCRRAIDGVRSADGASWSFDVSAVDLTGATGVAIYPVSSPTAPQFQVVLRLSLEPATVSTAPVNRSTS